MSPPPIVLIYATAPSMDVAQAMARALLDQRLIACANIMPDMTSMYRWQGQIETAAEVSILFKTTAERAEAAIAAGRALHPYETPAFMVLPATGGHPPFLEWIATQTDAAGR
jgi:periplasmic divalent cation tolerance protein